MIKLSVSMLAFAALAGLSGCSSMQGAAECPLEGHGAGRCMSMQSAYAAAQAGGSNADVSVFDAPSSKERGATATPVYGALGNYPEPDKAMPVFQQPKVFRPWLAPYVDADGVLHSGEYAYFNTPGAWNYGELRKPGAGGAVMGPVKPWETGFNPDAVAKPAASSSRTSRTAPAAPPEAPPATAPQKAQAPVPVVDPASGITQPYQRLN